VRLNHLHRGIAPLRDGGHWRALHDLQGDEGVTAGVGHCMGFDRVNDPIPGRVAEIVVINQITLGRWKHWSLRGKLIRAKRLK
jgi:hypothetical protein